jgi:hypothetical protein
VRQIEDARMFAPMVGAGVGVGIGRDGGHGGLIL